MPTRAQVPYTGADVAAPKNVDAIGVEVGKLPALSISTGEIADDAVTAPKIAGAPTAGTYVQTFATADKTHAVDGSAAMPAGGTGTAAGGWDTAANRDQAIAEFAALRTTVADLKQLVNSVIDDLQTLGLVT